LDYWPFGRLRFGQDWWRPKAPGESWWAWPRAAITPGRAVLEKLPFFVGVLISCAVTLYGFSHSNALVSDERFSWGLRLANTPISHVRYLGKLFWPADLAVLYPMPTHWAAWKVVAAAALLLALTAAFIALIRRAPYFMVGWLWFLGVLVPMIGLVSMGLQSIADRYTYVPFIGLFVMIAWGAERLRFPGKSVVAVAILGVCAVVSWRQTQHWRDTETLFTQCVKVTTNNPEAHYNLALACYLKGDRTNALQHFQEAVRIRPTYEDALNNLALVCLETGDAAQATNHLGRLLRLSPRNQFALLTMARALVVLGDYRQAKGYAELLQSPEAHVELARTLQKSGLTNEARIHLREAERLKTERR